MSKKIKIVEIVSELPPFSKSGGLADVACSLPKAISKFGHKVKIITPLYGKIINKEKHNLKLIKENVEVHLNSKESVKVSYYKGYLKEDIPVYFIENKKYFSKRKDLYCSSVDNTRFLVFNVASLKLISLLKLEVDIVHCHDWQTGLIPFYIKHHFRYAKNLEKVKTVFTIHNIIFQLGHNWWEIPIERRDRGRKKIPHISDERIEDINFTRRAILSADAISTVSEQYREEIISNKFFGQDLNKILKNREDRFFGIVNGIDEKAHNPKNDPNLFKNYSIKSALKKRKENKRHVQEKFGLAVDPKIPLICTTSRITFQKGFELVEKISKELMKLNLQIIIVGTGDKNYFKPLKKLARKYPHKLVVIPSHDACIKNETQLYAGSDFFLLPSHQEPCGINQLKAMRYGCVPIVRGVGGLHDTVDNFNPETGKGTGISFKRFSRYALYGAIIRAMETYKRKDSWGGIVERAMKKSSGWEIPARKYIQLYRKVLKNKRTK